MPTALSSYEEAIRDIETGNINYYDSVDDLIDKLDR